VINDFQKLGLVVRVRGRKLKDSGLACRRKA
jgi:hypothetical protein